MEEAFYATAGRFRCGRKMGTWISIAPSTVNRTIRSPQELRYLVFHWYIIYLPDLLCRCDGYEVSFSIWCNLDFKKGGLVMSCHNKLNYGVANLAVKAITTTYMRNDHLINPGRSMQSGTYLQNKWNPPNNPQEMEVVLEQTSEFLIRDLWAWRMDCILDTRFYFTEEFFIFWYFPVVPSGTTLPYATSKRKKVSKRNTKGMCLYQRYIWSKYVFPT